MKKIEVKILNPEVIKDAEKMAAIGARLTQSGEKISCMDDFMALYNKPASKQFIDTLCKLPHPILQHLCKINIAIVGISRREMTQLVRHRTDVHFVSSSLQYSDFSDNHDFMIPYKILEAGEPAITDYLQMSKIAMEKYKELIAAGIDRDAAGYITPQGLRNVLILSATPFELKHIISQRICRRNTEGTRYVMLKIWEELYKLSPELFSIETTGPWCQQGTCKEGKMTCGKIIDKTMTPTDILRKDYPLLYEN